MRLWHQELITKLPRQQLLGQHRECAALRGNGWGKKHRTVDYVFRYNRLRLAIYHELVIKEMIARNYNPDLIWLDKNYRGKLCDADKHVQTCLIDGNIYVEHDDVYLVECVENLRSKGIII